MNRSYGERNSCAKKSVNSCQIAIGSLHVEPTEFYTVDRLSMEKLLQIILQTVLDVPEEECEEIERPTNDIGDDDPKLELANGQPPPHQRRSCHQGLSILACDLIARVYFYPSLLQLYLATKLTDCEWYSRIDDRVCLGALPTSHRFAQRLVSAENVVGVVSLNEDYELRRFPVLWATHGVEFLQLSTRDIIDAPSQAKIRRAIEFVDRLCSSRDDNNDDGGAPKDSVYIHCKVGRTRSATVVVCYLMKKYDWNPAEATAYVTEKRKNVLLGPRQRAAVQKFFESLKLGAAKPESKKPANDTVNGMSRHYCDRIALN